MAVLFPCVVFCLVLSSFSALVPKFTTHFDDVTAPEHTTAEFTVELNDEDFDVTWLIKGVEVTPDNDKYTVVKNGNVHTLLIADVTEADQGDVSVTTGDISCNAQLTVEGKTKDRLSWVHYDMLYSSNLQTQLLQVWLLYSQI